MITIEINEITYVAIDPMLLKVCVAIDPLHMLLLTPLTQKGNTTHPNELLDRWFALGSHHISSCQKERRGLWVI